jgi:alcohol dehydrogenase class IV
MLSADLGYNFDIRFGAGRIARLGAACAELSMARPLLVTDRQLVDTEVVASALNVLRSAALPINVFAELDSNPSVDNVSAGVAQFNRGDHDGVIAIGGGSALDCGKAIALMHRQDAPIQDFVYGTDSWETANESNIAPIIGIPTTAGTGAEVEASSMITDPAKGNKLAVFHPKMLPSIIISDPELTVGLPPRLTAATGMDVLTHALEALCVDAFHPIADGIAIEALRRVHDWLPRAYGEPHNVEARGHMLVAASMGALAFVKGLGAVHALSHPIGAIYDTHHGLTNAVLLPYVLDYNWPAIEDKLHTVACALNLAGGNAAAALNWILELRETLAIPHLLSGLNIEQFDAVTIARTALTDVCAPTNPRSLDETVFRTILDASCTGQIQNL